MASEGISENTADTLLGQEIAEKGPDGMELEDSDAQVSRKEELTIPDQPKEHENETMEHQYDEHKSQSDMDTGDLGSLALYNAGESEVIENDPGAALNGNKEKEIVENDLSLVWNGTTEREVVKNDQSLALNSITEREVVENNESLVWNGTSEREVVENDRSMEISEETAENVSAEEALSDQSQLSEGIIINTEGQNRVAAFDSEPGPPNLENDPMVAVVKIEPADPEEDPGFAEPAADISLTQYALQLQYSERPESSGVALLKQEPPIENPGKSTMSPHPSPPWHSRSGGISDKQMSKMPKIRKKMRVAKNQEISPLGQKILQRGHSLRAEDLPQINTMDFCLVCSAPCKITRNRKIPSLPFCRKCKKAYFYQLGHQNKRPGRCFSGKKCVIHYKNGNHCTICHHDKFQRILRAAQASFRSRTDSKEESKKGPKSSVKDFRTHEFVNDQRLVQEALNSYPLVVLNKMAMTPGETVDTKDLPQVPSSSEKRATPRMFVMPFEEDVVKQENPYFINAAVPYECSGTSNVLEDDKIEFPPKLGPIKIPSFTSQGRASKSSSESSMSSPLGSRTLKRGRGRPKKLVEPIETQRPKLLSQILSSPQQPVLKKLVPEEKDIKIYVFECGHACSACNNSTSREWLKSNGYLSAQPCSKKSPDLNIQSDSSLYQKFVEFYNAAVLSAQQKPGQKSPKSGGSSSKKSIPKLASVPVPTSVVPNSASQQQMVLFPPPQFNVMDLSSPSASIPHSSFNIANINAPPLPSSLPKSVEMLPPPPIPSSSSPLRGQLSPLSQTMFNKSPIIPNRLPGSLANMDAVRLALNSHLLKQDLLQPNRFLMPSPGFPLGLPMQAITPSSSVRQPGAPYFLSPSNRIGSSNKSSSSNKQKKL
ncbi:hypothetical protein PoB_000956600 [Plakobranchus ocellatus]|uniref:Uncharacterized protein n=1 Tax=Plakobranchus ocellatus TaxID=259542 RepID=A0AAV3Y719_9GAST|nr:hypothetical protein PoB_000956600 [Plakobranchus ocellatus]